MVSALFNHIPPAIHGWGHASSMRFLKHNEDSARQGFNRITTIISQIAQFVILSEQVALLEKIHQTIYLPTSIQVISYVAIPLIAGACEFLKSTDEYPNLKKRIKLLHANAGLLFQVASVITTIALFQAGCLTYASFALVSLAVDLLVYKKVMPSPVRYVYLKAQFWITSASNLLSNSLLLKVLSTIDVASAIMNHAKRTPSVPYDQVNPISYLKDYEQFEKILSGHACLEVNRDHVKVSAFPNTTVQNFTPLMTLCNQLNWKNPETLQSLESALEKDARWLDFIESDDIQKQLAEDKSAVQINYLKTKFQVLVSSIENETIETGEPLDYGILKKYLSYITENLPSTSLNLQQQIIIDLAVTGGDYCGPGAYNQLEIASTALLNAKNEVNGKKEKRLPLKQRLLLILEQERLRIVQAYHLLSSKINDGINFVHGGQGDAHAFNYTANVIGYDFGLPDQGAKQDDNAIATGVDQLMYFAFLRLSAKDVWKDTTVKYRHPKYRKIVEEVCLGYTPNRVVKACQSQIGISLISKLDIYEWAQNWINRLETSSEIKESFLEKLTDGESFEKNLQFKDAFINAMLVDMGILKIQG